MGDGDGVDYAAIGIVEYEYPAFVFAYELQFVRCRKPPLASRDGSALNPSLCAQGGACAGMNEIRNLCLLP